MTCERSTMQLMGNGIFRDKEHSRSLQHTTMMLSHQTKTSRHHQECTLFVCRCTAIFLSATERSYECICQSFWRNFTSLFSWHWHGIFCVCDVLNSLACANLVKERKMRERRELWGEDVRNPHFLLMEKGGERGREKERERGGKKIRDRNVFSTFPSYWSYVDHY